MFDYCTQPIWVSVWVTKWQNRQLRQQWSSKRKFSGSHPQLTLDPCFNTIRFFDKHVNMKGKEISNQTQTNIALNLWKVRTTTANLSRDNKPWATCVLECVFVRECGRENGSDKERLRKKEKEKETERDTVDEQTETNKRPILFLSYTHNTNSREGNSHVCRAPRCWSRLRHRITAVKVLRAQTCWCLCNKLLILLIHCFT